MSEKFSLKSEDIMSSGKGNKKTIVILITVVAILILMVLGYFGRKIYTERQKDLRALQEQVDNLKKEAEELGTRLSNQNDQVDKDVAERPVEERKNPEDEYAGWNTYVNSEVGYQLKYPTDWTVKETNTFSELTEQDTKYIVITTPDKKYFLYFGLKKKNDNFSISDRTGVGTGEFIQEGNINILDTSVAVKKLVYKNKVKEYFFPDSGFQKTADEKYHFRASFSPGDTTDYNSLNMLDAPELEKAKLILSSVKIIARASEQTGCSSTLTSSDRLITKNWKTFKNRKYDYSLKYPKDWSYEKTSDKLVNFTDPENELAFSWRSEEMTVMGAEGWEMDGAQKNFKIACQPAKSTHFKRGDERMILTQFKKDDKSHMIGLSYKHTGASASGDIKEIYDLILKSVEFE